MTTNPNRSPLEKVELLNAAYNHLSMAAAALFEAGSAQDMYHCHTIMNIVQMDHNELVAKHFPIVSKK